ncbi:hypothetical protein ABPG72_000250 [Tetrahymena utriculariae]
MELEKALFRIHERLLSQDNIQQMVKIVKIAFTVLGLIMVSVFFYANIVHRNVEGCVGKAYNRFRDKYLEGRHLGNDTVVFINVCNYDKTLQPEPMSLYNYTFYDTQTQGDKKNDTANGNMQNPNKNTTDQNNGNTNINNMENNTTQNGNATDMTEQIEQLPSYIFSKRKLLKSHCTGQPKLQMEQAAIVQTLYYPKELRVVRNITTAVMYIAPTCYASNSFSEKIVYYILGIEPIVINEIITNFKYSDIHIKNILTDESWSWTVSQILSYNQDYILNFFYSFIRINLGLFYTSAISSLYIKISIICSPIFILLIMYCIRCLGSQDINIMTLIQTFPYIGLYLHALRGQKTNELVKSFMKMMLVIYFIYLSALFIGSLILFHKSIPKGLDENFLALLAVLELLIMLFVRTRSSLKWFPRVSILLMSTFLFYTQNTVYGYYSSLLSAIIFLILAFFCYILEEFEIPAVSWNESYHYTPSTHRPRVLYFPIFNLGWYYDLPQLWTMFYPLYGREHFTQAQLSLVDSNYILLNQTLDNAQRGNNNDLGILMNFQQNGNNNQNNNANQNNQAVNADNQNQANNQDGQPVQDIEMQNNNQSNQRQQANSQGNQALQSQSEDFFSEDNINRSREQHLLAREERASDNIQSNSIIPSSSGFYQGRGIIIGGSSTASSRQNEDSQQRNQNNPTEYQKLE